MEAKFAMQVKGSLGWANVALTALFAVCTTRLSAQAPPVASTVGSELQALGQNAAAIFVGQITSIDRAGGSVAISFRVEQPVRGMVGSTFVLREWAGLWPPGHNRYLAGQRVLAFLHAASQGGLSSPVHGAEGLVPVVVQGADTPQLLDIRRVAASILRTPGTPLPTEANGAIQLADALALIDPGGNAPGFDPARRRLPIRGQAPTTSLERLAAGTPVQQGSPQRPPLFAPVIRRAFDAHR